MDRDGLGAGGGFFLRGLGGGCVLWVYKNQDSSYYRAAVGICSQLVSYARGLHVVC